MEQSEQTEELELRIENLEYLEFLYQEMEKRRKALHQDISRIIESAFIQDLYPDIDFSVFASLENRILRKNEMEDIERFLTIVFNDLKEAEWEYLMFGILLSRWKIFHEKLPRQ